MTITIGTKFKSVSTGEIFTVVDIHTKSGQTTIEGPDGKTKAYSSTTMKDKRRFIPLEDESPEMVPVPVDCEKTDEQIKEDFCDDKAKVPKKQRKPQEPGIGDEIKTYIVETADAMGAEACTASSGKFISFKINGKMFAAIFSYSKKSATLGTRSAALEGSGISPEKKMNHMMDYRFTFDSLSEENKAAITKILRLSKDYQLTKSNKGGHK